MGQHRDFVSAIFSLGLTHCSPSVIMEEMKHLPKDISRENIKSHLQKFRKTADKSVEDFMQEFDAFLHRIENESSTKTVPPPNSSSSTQASKEHENSFDALETVMAGSDPTEILGGAAAAYAAYAVVHNYAPRNDRNKILYEGTREELPRLTAAEQESSLGRSLKQVKGALDFVRDLVLKRRHGIPFKLDKKIPPFLKKEDVAEHLPVISRHTSDVSDQNTRNNIYSGAVPNHVSMTVPAAPIYGPPHDYHYPAPCYPSHYSYPTADGSHGPFSRYGSQPPNRGGYASYGEFHHPVMHNMPPPSGYPSLHYNPYQVGPYMHPESAHPAMPDHYPPPLHPSTGMYPGTMDSSHYSIMGLPPQQYHAAPDVYFEPPQNSPSHFQQYPEEPTANPVRSSGTHKTSTRTSVPFYPSKSGSLEREQDRETFDTSLQTTTRPSKTAHSPTESTSTKRQWSPIVSAPLDEPDPGHTKHQHKRPKTDLAVDTSASCTVDRPLSYELADLGLHTGPDTPDTHDAAVEGGGQSSPFSVTSVLRNAMMMQPPQSATPDRVVLDFGRSVPTPSDDDRRHRRSRRDRDHGTPFPS
jgi:SHAQKYF class myb-like DNA-binding protein